MASFMDETGSYGQESTEATTEDFAARLRETVAQPLDGWHEVYESFSPVNLKTGEQRPRVPGPGDELLLVTVLREAKEEINLRPDLVEVIGKLEEIYIPPSGFLVRPFVGLLPQEAK